MKKLFVITSINKKEKEPEQNRSPIKIKIDEEKSKLELDLPQSQSESTNLSQSPKTDTSDYSRKYSLNALSTDNSISANLNNILELNNKPKEKKEFLGKKSKFHFNIIKPFPESEENKLNIPIIEKELNDIKPKSKFLKFKSKLSLSKKKNIKEGRWTKEENKKFIEAFIENGKKWKIIQKYVESRTCAQTRSHAQKFLLKLKSISNEEFNFKNDSIKNLNDILEEIKKKKGIKNLDDNDDKKYLIDILLNLSERCCENNSTGNNNKNNINDISPNDDNKSINNNNKNIDEEIKENNVNNKDEENLYINNNTKNDKKENNEEINNNNSEKNNEYWENNYSYEQIEQKLVFDDGFAFYINKNSIYNFNNISYYINEFNFNRNIEKSRYINRDFFS